MKGTEVEAMEKLKSYPRVELITGYDVMWYIDSILGSEPHDLVPLGRAAHILAKYHRYKLSWDPSDEWIIPMETGDAFRMHFSGTKEEYYSLLSAEIPVIAALEKILKHKGM